MDIIHATQELVTGGELFDRIAQKEFYTEKDARNVACTLLATVGYLHAQGIIHRYLSLPLAMLTHTRI